MAHNTTYHQSLKCTPSEVFYGRIPFNTLDLKFSNSLKCETTETYTAKLVDQVNEKYKQVDDNILQAYHKYKRYYDRKAQALPLKVYDFAFLLNPKVTTQSHKIAFNQFKWEGFFKVVEFLTNFNYTIKKFGTLRTQCVHRMRLRPFTQNAPIPDIEEDPNLFFCWTWCVLRSRVLHWPHPSTNSLRTNARNSRTWWVWYRTWHHILWSGTKKNWQTTVTIDPWEFPANCRTTTSRLVRQQ